MDKQSSLRFYFPLATQYTNQGDLLINVCAALILSRFGEVQIDFGKCPAQFRNQFISLLADKSSSISECPVSIRGLGIFSRIRFGKRLDWIILPPGPKEWKQRRDFRRLISSLLRISWVRLWRFFGGKVLSFGNSLAGGEVGGPDLLSLIQLKQIDAFGLRSNHDVALARQYSITNANYFPDLAFFGKDLFVERQLELARECLVLSFRNDGDLTQNVIEELIKFFASKYGSELRILLVYQVEADAEFAELLVSQFAKVERTVHCIKLDDATSLDFYRSARVVVSNRLHVCLAGLLCGAIPLFLSGREHYRKTSILLESVGLDAHVIDLNDISNSLNSINHAGVLDKSQACLAEVINKQVDVGNKFFKKMFEVLY